jgi:hypothetical protein
MHKARLYVRVFGVKKCVQALVLLFLWRMNTKQALALAIWGQRSSEQMFSEASQETKIREQALPGE